MDIQCHADACSCIACYGLPWTKKDRERRRHDIGKPDQRKPFEKDRDRILYSSAFHRLAGVTQIVRADEADVLHTRQQHTYKVAQIGRRLAEAVIRRQRKIATAEGVDPEVVEAACLAHDLGHPPFGHIGEYTLDDLVRDKGEADGFEGNAQTFRILTKLAVRFSNTDGMNLTRATLAASLKYPWMRASKGQQSKKWSAYNSEKDDFEFAREFSKGTNKTAEAELMDWADDVAYSVHDLEDFHRCNVIPWQRIFEDPNLLISHALESWKNAPVDALPRLISAHQRLHKHIWGAFSETLIERYDGSREHRNHLRSMTSQMIGKYIRSVSLTGASEDERRVTFIPEDVDEIRILKQITRDHVIATPSLAAQQHGQKRILEYLFDQIFEGSKGDKEYPDFLPARLRYLRGLAKTSTPRFVADCVASLTEKEAIGLYGRLSGTAAGSVFDPIVR